MQLFGRTRENECRQELLSAGRELLSPSAEGEREEGFLLAGAELLSPCPRKEVEERKESFSGEFSLLRPKKEVDNSQEEGEKEVSLSWHREVGNRMVQLENYQSEALGVLGEKSYQNGITNPSAGSPTIIPTYSSYP